MYANLAVVQETAELSTQQLLDLMDCEDSPPMRRGSSNSFERILDNQKLEVFDVQETPKPRNNPQDDQVSLPMNAISLNSHTF